MPLDPQFGPIIDAYRKIPPISEIPLAILRSSQVPPPPSVTPVEVVENRSIPGPGGELKLRIYRSGSGGDLPLLLFIHGGGFVVGGLDTHDELARRLTAAARCVTVAVDYRLAPESPFPAAADDCFAALQWAAANARELGADPARVVAIGDSAGGNLAAVSALQAREAGGPPLSGQVLMYPVTDLTAPFPPAPDGEYYMVYPKLHDFFMESYLKEPSQARLSLVSPGLADTLAGLPPALVITAEYDPLCDQGEAFASRLEEAGVRTSRSRYDGAIHGFASFPVPMRDTVVAEIADWISKN